MKEKICGFSVKFDELFLKGVVQPLATKIMIFGGLHNLNLILELQDHVYTYTFYKYMYVYIYNIIFWITPCTNPIV